MVLAPGLEPGWVTPLVPKTSVSTNSTTRASIDEWLSNPYQNIGAFAKKKMRSFPQAHPPHGTRREMGENSHAITIPWIGI